MFVRASASVAHHSIGSFTLHFTHGLAQGDIIFHLMYLGRSISLNALVLSSSIFTNDLKADLMSPEM